MEKNFNFMIYKYADDETTVNAVVKDDTIWLTQKSMAELFDVQTPAISKHLKNIFEEGELDEQVVVSKMETTSKHGAISGKTPIFIIWMQLFQLDTGSIPDGQHISAFGQQVC